MSLVRKYKIYRLLKNKNLTLQEKGFAYIDDILSKIKNNESLDDTVNMKNFLNFIITEYLFEKFELYDLLGYLLQNKINKNVIAKKV